MFPGVFQYGFPALGHFQQWQNIYPEAVILPCPEPLAERKKEPYVKQENTVKVQDDPPNDPNQEIPQKFTDRFDKIQFELFKSSDEVKKTLWSENEDKVLLESAQELKFDWKRISKRLPNRNPKMCYNRFKRLSLGKKRLWTQQEDALLKRLVEVNKLQWRHMEGQFKERKAKQLRQRYINFLRPQISREPWSFEEDLKFIELIAQFGKKWKYFESVLTNRSENQIKNRYYGRLKHKINKKTSKSNSYQS